MKIDNARIQRLQSKLHTPCFIERPEDLLYLTGLNLSLGRLFISGSEATLYVDGRYYEFAKSHAPCNVELLEEQKKIAHTHLGFDSSFVTYEGFLSLQKQFPNAKWEPISNPVKRVRAIKDVSEVAALKRAADLTWKGYRHILTLLKEGVSEEEIAFEYEFYCRKHGATGMSFDPIIAFGENSAYPHHRAGKTRLKHNQVVLIDVGAIVDLYHGDMTRIAHFGTPDPRILHFEQIVTFAQRKAVEHVKPGVKMGHLDQIVRDEFDRANVKPLYMHSLGHGVGLETHEFPRLRFDGVDKDVPLEPGMVVTIEPGLYQAGIGGIRIEDMVLVTETGHEVLTPR